MNKLDLIQRLRGWPNLPGLNLDKDLMNEAADELERLRAQVAPAGEAVASLYISPHGEREVDDWKCKLPPGRHELFTAAPAQRAELESARQQGFYAGLALPAGERAELEAAGVIPETTAAPSLTVGDEPEDERGLALWQLIYAAIAHEPLPLKVAQIEAAAKRVEDMLKRRAASKPAAQGVAFPDAYTLANLWNCAEAAWNAQVGHYPEPWEHFADLLRATLAQAQTTKEQS